MNNGSRSRVARATDYSLLHREFISLILSIGILFLTTHDDEPRRGTKGLAACAPAGR
jgi:hypothetical protein